ncbi:tapasin-related protein-like [Heterodontus francisci]|uniref:tapasin-related protein-like n=1 Tax=Heterodontus francisci TaxID=7792 RepID=UPI00355AFC50
MSASMICLCLTLRGIIHAAAYHISFKVTQTPKVVTAAGGREIIFYCAFPIFPDHSSVRVHWWKQGENEYLHTKPDRRKRFGLENKARGFFHLLSTTFQDSGVYHCAVIHQGTVQGNGTGSHLIVYVAPTPLNIVSRTPEGNSSASLTLECETAAFYPDNVILIWYKNGVETTLGIHTVKIQNSQGLYEVSSSLVETQPVLSDINYTCSVSHISLKTPVLISHTVSKLKQGAKQTVQIVCAVVGLAFLVLMIVIVTRYRLQNNEGRTRDSRQKAGVRNIDWFSGNWDMEQ